MGFGGLGLSFSSERVGRRSFEGANENRQKKIKDDARRVRTCALGGNLCGYVVFLDVGFRDTCNEVGGATADQNYGASGR